MIAYPNPVTSYQDALGRIPDVSIRPKMSTVAPISESILFTQGHPVKNAFLLLHGYTSSPQQFREMGQRLHAMGHNVFIPRMPHHGLEDRLSEEMGQLSASQLADYANRSLDIATALGDTVMVVGLSAGGVLTAYLGQTRDEVDAAMLISPSIGLAPVPPPLLPLLRKAAVFLPNQYIWWGKKGDMGVSQQHAYPRWSTHALAAILEVADHTMRLARDNRPKLNHAHLILNQNDNAIHAPTAKLLGNRWSKFAIPVSTHTFPLSDDLDHDLIDPDHPKQNIDHVYAKLFDILSLT